MMTDKEILQLFEKKRASESKKILIRPDFRMYKELFLLITALTIVTVTICLRSYLSDNTFMILLCLELILFIITQTKNIILLSIFLYQKFAPSFIRQACLFTPSCSEYMRLSVLKYGVIRGVRKGFGRLKRCRPPNGGTDMP